MSSVSVLRCTAGEAGGDAVRQAAAAFQQEDIDTILKAGAEHALGSTAT